jgi:hypothetical protein
MIARKDREPRTERLSVTLTKTTMGIVEKVAREKDLSFADVLRVGLANGIETLLTEAGQEPKPTESIDSIKEQVEAILNAVNRMTAAPPAGAKEQSEVKTREEVWAEFLYDVFLHLETGENSTPRKYLRFWLLGRQSCCPLEGVDRVWLEARMNEAVRRYGSVKLEAIKRYGKSKPDSETFTTQELMERYGWPRTNAATYARRRGWVEAGRLGKKILWQPPQDD